MGERNSGVDNDSYIDDCFLRINLDADSCSYYIADSSTTSTYHADLLNIKLYPNPVSNTSLLNIPYNKASHLQINIINITGEKVREYNHVHPPSFILNREGLSRGMKIIQILDQENIIGTVKFSIIE